MTPQELKNSILQLAIQGKLVEQRPEEGTGEELYQQIQEKKQKLIKDGKIKIGNNDLLKIHFYNSALKVNAETERQRLIKIDARSHIDGMASFLDAMCVRKKWWNEIGTRLVNERR